MTHLKTHFINLIHLCLIDNDLAESELDYLFRRGELLGLSEENIVSLINQPSYNHFNYPRSLDEIIDCIYDISQIILADSVIHENEKTWFKSYLTEINIKKDNISPIIDISLENSLIGYKKEVLKKKILNLIEFNKN